MKFKKPTKAKLQTTAVQATGVATGYFGTAYAKAKFGHKMANYGGADATDSLATATGIALAAATTGADTGSKFVQSVGVGVAGNGLSSLIARHVMPLFSKATKKFGKADGPKGVQGPKIISIAPRAALNNPTVADVYQTIEKQPSAIAAMTM